MNMGLKHFVVFALSFVVSYASSESQFFINKTGCYKTKGCISFPDSCSSSDDCDYLVTYVAQKDSVAFELSSKNEYAAFGLNNKPSMDGTDAIVCSKSINGSAATVGHYSLHHHNPPSISKPTPSGLTAMAGAYENGRIACRFKRSITATPPIKYNLNSKHFFMYSRGKISDNGGLTHHLWKRISNGKQPITSKGPVQQSNDFMIAIHASLMLVAWIGFASVGMFTARNMKTLFGNRTCLNEKLWFQVHRCCMALTTLLTMAGIVVIFVYAKGWSQVAGWHAIIGIMVVSLATLQPSIALFRPSLNSDRRYIFNWIHRCIAVTVFGLAMSNCFLGLNLFDQPPLTRQLGFCVISTFLVTYVSVLLLYELYMRCCYTKKEESLLESDQHNTSSVSVENDTSDVQVKAKVNAVVGMVLYSFAILVAIGICTTFITLLVLSIIKQTNG